MPAGSHKPAVAGLWEPDPGSWSSRVGPGRVSSELVCREALLNLRLLAHLDLDVSGNGIGDSGACELARAMGGLQKLCRRDDFWVLWPASQ